MNGENNVYWNQKIQNEYSYIEAKLAKQTNLNKINEKLLDDLIYYG